MEEDDKAAQRSVPAPGTGAGMRAGDLLSVELAPDEAVEWVWSHDRGGSRVTGYRIVPADGGPDASEPARE
jgi:hypothetical protein